ncbi:MAG: response regulator [Bacillota bacterium]|jgi:two-component system response regulator (stage 0 sporulation protein F)
MGVPKVLIVDDQSSIRRLLTEYFQTVGWQTLAAANGQEAVLKLQESPDVILLDMKMPVMDGLETLRHVRSMGKQIPVIMMTAYGELGLLHQAKTLGADDTVQKPFDLHALGDKVAELCMAQSLPASTF